jgi:hypothetical protein
MNDFAGDTMKIIAAKNAVTKFVSILDQSGGLAYKIAVIEFSTNVTVICNLTSGEGAWQALPCEHCQRQNRTNRIALSHSSSSFD